MCHWPSVVVSLTLSMDSRDASASKKWGWKKRGLGDEVWGFGWKIPAERNFVTSTSNFDHTCHVDFRLRLLSNASKSTFYSCDSVTHSFDLAKLWGLRACCVESDSQTVLKVSNQIKSIWRAECWMANLVRSSQRKLSFGGGWQEVIGALPPFLIYSRSCLSSHGKQFFSELLFSHWSSEV